ncbi:MAG: RpoD subfamily RNA polymerase sigma-70 subunit, RNA polymerase primary sigma factor [Candidatus Peregrinibacteria bacterium GW2011_GWF2_43_17]|nr:MAG: RpoD subfamily RNA polymerase sigma-70 subunit, RNA polymerase primary sigma factor [Candidatus Peregrinibacteria bacterium GW2011_GWF2_43_17]KKT18475.1 MAG: RNA polymerase sigma factor [Candidatus Peregrinibacteria bacterium GW2011_GWA2_43_8]HAU39716.1 hypothetical protein [Candidatus Peregrinibacteria bacterium]
MADHQLIEETNLAEILEELFMVLSEKEREVIVKRFSLDNSPRETLESIGKRFSVTRERVRQIEKIALTKLRRTSKNTKLRLVNEIATALIRTNGGVMLEDDVISGIFNKIKKPTEVDRHIIILSLSVNDDLDANEKFHLYRNFWYLKIVDFSNIEKVADAAKKQLKEKGDTIAEMKLARDIQALLKTQGTDVTEEFATACLKIDKEIKKVESEYGLMVWRHVNPKSIRDKSYIVLKKCGRPLHFIEIANKITEAAFDKKIVTIQAVHNELIRCEKFVLVGRGLYALKEWGYFEGTVADIIESLLAKKGKMTKKEIIEGVLKQRQVKRGTISLNLQKKACFARVGRALYALDLTRK